MKKQYIYILILLILFLILIGGQVFYVMMITEINNLPLNISVEDVQKQKIFNILIKNIGGFLILLLLYYLFGYYKNNIKKNKN